jgi:hypothetical protein
MDRTNSLDGQTALQVTIDGKPLQLPDWLADSLPSIRTYLECVAMKSDRVLWALQVDGIKLDLTESEFALDNFRTVRANTITYDELKQRLISAGRTKVQELLAGIKACSLLVVINDSSFAHNLWLDWEPQLSEPLFSLRALEELRRTQGEDGEMVADLPHFLEHLSFIACEVESLFRDDSDDSREADTVAFSEILDYTLLPWLTKLDQIFQHLQADQPGF